MCEGLAGRTDMMPDRVTSVQPKAGRSSEGRGWVGRSPRKESNPDSNVLPASGNLTDFSCSSEIASESGTHVTVSRVRTSIRRAIGVSAADRCRSPSGPSRRTPPRRPRERTRCSHRGSTCPRHLPGSQRPCCRNRGPRERTWAAARPRNPPHTMKAHRLATHALSLLKKSPRCPSRGRRRRPTAGHGASRALCLDRGRTKGRLRGRVRSALAGVVTPSASRARSIS